jgi:hypothetical protein
VSKPGPKGITKKMVLLALEANGGMITQSARALGIARQSLAERIAKHQIDLAPYQEDRLEQLKDGVEGGFHKLLADFSRAPGQETWEQARYFLDNKARDRGYGQRMEITGRNGGPIEVASPAEYEAFLRGLTSEQRAQFEASTAPLPDAAGAPGDGPHPPVSPDEPSGGGSDPTEA